MPSETANSGSRYSLRFSPSKIARAAIRLALVMLAVAFIGFCVIYLGRVGLAFSLYARTAKWTSRVLGLDYYVARLFAFAVVAVALSVPSSFIWLFGRRKRSRAGLAALGVWGVACLLVYTVGSNVYFDRNTGEPLRYYADTPEGRSFSFTPGFDPKYGVPYKPYTREIAERSASVLPGNAAPGISMNPSDKPGMEAYIANLETCPGEEKADSIRQTTTIMLEGRGTTCWMHWIYGMCNNGVVAISSMAYPRPLPYGYWIHGVPPQIIWDPDGPGETRRPWVVGGLRIRIMGVGPIAVTIRCPKK